MKAISLALICAAALSACGDPTRIRATRPVVTDTLVAFALTGTPLSAPTALSTFLRRTVRAEPNNQYDVVFDLNAAGQVVILPPSLVDNTGRTGLQKSATPFAALQEAPLSGYNESAALTVSPGEVAVLRATPVACNTPAEFSPYLYSKLVIDSVSTTRRAIYFRMRLDPNCGFRSFADGVPQH